MKNSLSSDLSTGNVIKVEASSDAIGFGRRLSAPSSRSLTEGRPPSQSRTEGKPASRRRTEGRKEGIIKLSTKNLGNTIEVHIRDNGPGIPQNVIDKVFQPFFTTKPTGQGTGLGLSLSYDIVKAHGGNIKVISNQGPPGGSITVNSFNGPPGGELKVETATAKNNEGAEFIIQLPINTN